MVHPFAPSKSSHMMRLVVACGLVSSTTTTWQVAAHRVGSRASVSMGVSNRIGSRASVSMGVSSWYDSGVRLGSDIDADEDSGVRLGSDIDADMDAAARFHEERRAAVQARAADRAGWTHGAQFSGRAQEESRWASEQGQVNKGFASFSSSRSPITETLGSQSMSRSDWSQRAQDGGSLGGD